MREVRTLKEQLENIGLGPHVASVQEFIDIAEGFVQTGINQTGVIKLPSETDRVLVFELVNKKNVSSNIVIKYIGNNT